jgi:hypothetical protein
MGLIVNIEVVAGTDINKACNDALVLAIKLGVMIRFDFNGVLIYVTSSSIIEEVLSQYHAELKKNANK